MQWITLNWCIPPRATGQVCLPGEVFAAAEASAVFDARLPIGHITAPLLSWSPYWRWDPCLQFVP